MHTVPSPEAANVLRERVARRTTQEGDLSDIQPGKTVCCNVLKPGHLKLVKCHDFIAWIKEENVSVVDIQAAALTQSSPSRQTRVSKRVARGWEDAGRIEAAGAAKTARKKRRIDRFMRPCAVVSRVARWCWSTFLLVFWYPLGSIESIGAATVKRIRADAHAAAAAATLVLSTDTFVSEWTYDHCDFYSKFNAFYLPFVRNQRFNDSVDLCVGGDKGYTYLSVNTGDDSFPAGTQILSTHTGKIDVSETEDPDGKQSAAQSLAEFQKKHPEVTFSAEFQKYRAVVERVIGRMKQLSNTVRGPRQVTLMDSKLDTLLRIYCGIINRQLRRNKYWFVTET
mmetsp:Transcript_9526/g.30193  ORF Transcript_9526/g.30193 Transcript_9526/m.30193 type:complete len:339 (-) Transcript_9526:1100-2116(-)